MAASEQLISVLEDTASLLKKAKINISKCPKQRFTKGYIEARLRCVEEYWQAFKKSHEDLIRATTREQRGVLPYFLNEEYHTHEELYLCMQADLMDMLASVVPTSSRSLSAHSHGTSRDQPIKLPKIQLTVFSGLYEEFPAFQDLFTSLVHNNGTLSNVQKLHYLKTSVSGEAASLLKHIQVTDSNYTQAWNTLKHRYGNKRLIVNSLLKRLITQKKIIVKSASHIKSLLDTTSECLNSLKNLDISTDSWDPLIIFLVVQKLDPESHKDWEALAYKDNSEELPKWADLKKFLENTFRTLEMISPPTNIKERTTKTFHVATEDKTCVLCKESHYLCHCKEFSKMQPTERSEYAKFNKLCYNCLVPGHAVSKCRIRMSCRICRKRHHTLLHTSSKADTSASTGTIQPTVSALSNVEDNEDLQVHTMVASHTYSTRQALLATALVSVRSNNGRTIMLRALIDPGSQASFISEKATQFLKLTRMPAKRSVVGVGSTRTSINHAVHLNIISRYDTNYTLPIEAFVMSKQLTTKIPTKALTCTHWPHIENLQLADPSYCTSGSIDLLIGVKEYAKILLPDLIKGSPCAQNTKLGWILFGDIDSSVDSQECSFIVMHHQIDIDEVLKSIWEIDTDNKRRRTKEEKICEEIYEKSYTRNEDGRYIVKLPFNTEYPKSPDGNTRERALHRFNLLEKRFNRTPGLREVYTKAIEEYKEMKHAEEVPAEEIQTKRSVNIPHLAVIREGKETTSVRVVFDASSKGSNGISLNDELLLGPLLQNDLRSLIMRWRMHAVCFVSDIEKMYRMILITKEDADYQRFLWRDHPHEPVKDYRLLTVTFGTASAPYLAIKTLIQLAIDEGDKHPVGAQITQEDFYVDDVLSGCDTVEQAIHASRELKLLLQRGGFKLKKWSSNSVDFMRSIVPEERSSKVHLDLNIAGTTKALGILWNLKTDQFQYNSTAFEECAEVTKRKILSDIQKLFDPLGWIAPLIVMAKILIQKLWLERVDWDDEISQPLKYEWATIKSDLKNNNLVHIHRWLHTFSTEKRVIHIHGFSDASMKAYAAAVYCRVEKPDGTIHTHLVAAQTKVAPLKTISLPRLELCGAVLLSKLLKQVAHAMKIPMSQVFAWTDSTIVISWLLGEPNRWKPFVANRVVEIIENLNGKQWFHVLSHDNPADIASRGMLLKDLKDCSLWWKGPQWLSERNLQFIKPETNETDLESKKIHVNLKINEEEQKERNFTEQYENFDTLLELLKTITLCMRFLNYRKLKEDIVKNITPKELEKSLHICIMKTQNEDFREEIEAIRRKKHVGKRSNLKSLNPYLDSNGILRVGGRLRHANLDENNKHPIILTHTSKLTSLIVADAHLKTLHGGIQLMMCYLRSKYWIIRGKSLVKSHLHRCLVCARQSATTRTQLMGDLPKARVTPSRVFSHSGVDFAGPFQVLTSKGKGIKTKKAYIAIFVCMATKAIHIELVGDMTSEAFIGAFKRFVSRRGKCSHLWSDQGRNFVGANKDLVAAWKEANLEFSGEISDLLLRDNTEWHFIPPYSPNYGGLWEAGVKSIKYHLKRILTTHLTFEEFTTVLCEIEACLNSRPLCPLDDSEAIEILTPGHFLIGEAPNVIPSPSLLDTKVSNLTRWQYTQKLLNDFWKRWQQDYLSRLQQRPKWLKRQDEFDLGQIVLIKNEMLPPGKWALGRIVEKHPGADGVTRVYSVKCGNNVIKRSISKLCFFPVSNEDSL